MYLSEASTDYKNRPVMGIVIGFFAGFLAVLVFHQLTLAGLSAAGITKNMPYSMKLVGPLAIPQFISAAFWGGVWGIALQLISQHWRRDVSYVLKAMLFGAVGPTLVSWFVVAWLKGLPLGGGFKTAGIITGLSVNAAWGVGTALFILLAARFAKQN